MATTQSTPDQIEFLIKKYPATVLRPPRRRARGRRRTVADRAVRLVDVKDGHVLPVVCVAGGAGMAPILSILRHLEEPGSTRPVPFYLRRPYGGRPVYLEAIKELGAELTGFDFIACLSSRLRTQTGSRSRKAMAPISSSGGKPSCTAARCTCAVRRRWSTPPWRCWRQATCRKTRSSTTSSPAQLPMESGWQKPATQLPGDRVHRPEAGALEFPSSRAVVQTTSRPSCARRCTITSRSTDSPIPTGT